MNLPEVDLSTFFFSMFYLIDTVTKHRLLFTVLLSSVKCTPLLYYYTLKALSDSQQTLKKIKFHAAEPGIVFLFHAFLCGPNLPPI